MLTDFQKQQGGIQQASPFIQMFEISLAGEDNQGALEASTAFAG
jgi:hypothetical protein